MSAIARGTRIAFCREGSVLVCTYPDVDKVTRVGEGQDPSLTADGTRISYEEQTGGEERRFVIRETATGRLLARHAGTRPFLSPDGQRVAYSLYSKGRWSLWSSDRSLRNPRDIGNREGKSGPAFGNGWVRGFIIAHDESDTGNLYALGSDGTVQRKVPLARIAAGKNLSIPLGCAWSPDFNQVVLEAMTGETRPSDGEPLTALFLYDFRTGKQRRLTPRDRDGVFPVWYRADTIVFTANQSGSKKGAMRSGVYAMNTGTGATSLLIENANNAALSGAR
jgi:Tol biopolymer transport system component